MFIRECIPLISRTVQSNILNINIFIFIWCIFKINRTRTISTWRKSRSSPNKIAENWINYTILPFQEWQSHIWFSIFWSHKTFKYHPWTSQLISNQLYKTTTFQSWLWIHVYLHALTIDDAIESFRKLMNYRPFRPQSPSFPPWNQGLKHTPSSLSPRRSTSGLLSKNPVCQHQNRRSHQFSEEGGISKTRKTCSCWKEQTQCMIVKTKNISWQAQQKDNELKDQ